MGINPIDSNNTDMIGQQQATASNSMSAFPDIYSGMNYAGSVFGPVASTATGNETVAAAVNATAGNPYGTIGSSPYLGSTGGFSSPSISTGSSFNTSSAGSIMSSSALPVSSSATGTAAMSPSDIQNMLAASQQTAVQLLEVQVAAGDQAQNIGLLSGLVKIRNDSHSQVIQNMH